MSKDKRLGRGLAALLGEPVEYEASAPGDAAPKLHDPADASMLGASVDVAAGEMMLIEVQTIDSNPYQPRTEFKQEDLDSLAESLKAHDMLQPLLVRRSGDGFQLISGERRLKAAIQAGWTKVPCRIRQVNDREMAELAIVENLQRKDLNPIEKAQSFQRYLIEHECKHEELAERLRIDRSSVSNLLRLLELPDEVRKAITDGYLSGSHARALLPLGEEEEQINICRAIVKGGMSVRETESFVQAKLAEEDLPQVAGNTAERIQRTRSEQIISLEKDLKLAMGSKVEIKSNAKGRGKLSIHFKNNEEFERIYDLLLAAGGAEVKRAG